MVTELITNIRQTLTVLDQEAGVGMPEGMGLAIGEPRAPQERPPHVLPEGSWRHGLAISARDQPGRSVTRTQDAFRFLHGQESLQGTRQLATHVYQPRFIALGRIDPAVAECFLPASPGPSSVTNFMIGP